MFAGFPRFLIKDFSFLSSLTIFVLLYGKIFRASGVQAYAYVTLKLHHLKVA
jgi:hypothetical protein